MQLIKIFAGRLRMGGELKSYLPRINWFMAKDRQKFQREVIVQPTSSYCFSWNNNLCSYTFYTFFN